jgi:hypothetical protein
MNASLIALEFFDAVLNSGYLELMPCNWTGFPQWNTPCKLEPNVHVVASKIICSGVVPTYSSLAPVRENSVFLCCFRSFLEFFC